MEKEEIRSKVINIITDVLQSSIECLDVENANFIDILDSISFIQIIIRLEETFGIAIDDQYLFIDRFSNLELIVEMIQAVLKK